MKRQRSQEEEEDLLEAISKQFQNTHLRPQNVTPSRITLKHGFDRDACYCFLMWPIGYSLLMPSPYKLSTNDCRPNEIIPKHGKLLTDYLPMSNWEVVESVLLAGIGVVVVGIFVVILNCPVYLGKILGLKRQIAGQKTPSQKSMAPQNADVLLLYASDISGIDHLEKFKKHLQAAFKVYDVFDRHDHKRLADPCGWMEKVLMPGSGVKVLLLESVGLAGLITSLLKTHAENPGPAKVTRTFPQAQMPDNLLTFALRTIICTNLREDYSTVFIVRFSNEVIDEADFLVQMRRYKFPGHFSELIKAMKEARTDVLGVKEREVRISTEGEQV